MNENKHIEWRGLKGLRNRIVHDYEGINLDMVWRVSGWRIRRLKRANWRTVEIRIGNFIFPILFFCKLHLMPHLQEKLPSYLQVE